ncbi:uncharacterized protein GIQ15_02461 [Arthroderma uncinatum]|uniref:uncharacterized protein n=1 Tax=Arthroderma uncinatum TaxID=74035 RepID=UPI00144ACCE7|nr:uncharacterized protein GIQ15_02461 [Arthroderma uncinatum]KAF3483137.1 hypothetical protein GIQ15_02461 [Arthroderma uncinatum]
MVSTGTLLSYFKAAHPQKIFVQVLSTLDAAANMYLFFYFSLIISLLEASWAQNTPRQVVWGSVVFTRYGESVPYGLPAAGTLTPLGAQQLAGAGSAFRRRYIMPSSNPSLSLSRIQGLSVSLENSQVSVSTVSAENMVASAQAFMQGLYPPSLAVRLPSNMAEVNGSLVDCPLNGYQYPLISTYSFDDPTSAYISGNMHCPLHLAGVLNFFFTPEYKKIIEQADSFYKDLYPQLLFNVYDRSMLSLLNAPMIYEYLSYQYLHNSTARGTISSADIGQARHLANQWAHATSRGEDNILGRNGLLAIGGKTLAHMVLHALRDNEATKGASNKLSLIFGGHESMMAFINVAVSP